MKQEKWNGKISSDDKWDVIPIGISVYAERISSKMTLPPIRRPETNRKMKREWKALARPRLKDDAILTIISWLPCPSHKKQTSQHESNKPTNRTDKLKHRKIEK